MSPLSLDLGPRTLGSSASLTSSVTNDGTAAATDLAVGPPDGAFGASTDCGPTLAAGDSCTITWRFAPGSAGPATSTGTVSSSGGTARVALAGRGVTATTPTSTTTTSTTATTSATASAPVTTTTETTGTWPPTATSASTASDAAGAPTADTTPTGPGTGRPHGGPAPAGLAWTGATVGPLFLLGSAAVLVGAVALALARRRGTS